MTRLEQTIVDLRGELASLDERRAKLVTTIRTLEELAGKTGEPATLRRVADARRASTATRAPRTAPPNGVDASQRVLRAIRAGATQRLAVVKATGLPTYTVARAIAQLTAARAITATGQSRGTRYAVVGEPPAKEGH